MNDKFFAGLALGMLGGALIVANSVKARKMIKDGQEQVMEKMAEVKNKAQKSDKKQK